jgi:hypothetical protein
MKALARVGEGSSAFFALFLDLEAARAFSLQIIAITTFSYGV